MRSNFSLFRVAACGSAVEYRSFTKYEGGFYHGWDLKSRRIGRRQNGPHMIAFEDRNKGISGFRILNTCHKIAAPRPQGNTRTRWRHQLIVFSLS